MIHIITIENLKLKVFEWLFCGVVFTLPFARPHWNAKLILLLLISWLFIVKSKELRELVKTNIYFWLFISPVLLDIVGLAYSENLNFGLKYIETKTSLFVFPLIILSVRNQIGRETIDNILKWFILGVLFVVLSYLYATVTFLIANNFSISTLFSTRLSDNSSIFLSSWVTIHPSFLSLYISFCIFIVINKLVQTHNVDRIRLFPITILLVFVLFLIWLNSRAGIIGFVVVGLVYIFIRTKRKIKVVAIASLLLTCTLILFIPFTKERFITAPINALKQGAVVSASDQSTWPISFRLQILECSIDLLKNYHWIYGYGTGDFRDRIYQCYEEKSFGWLIARNLDAHSEYFSQLHRHGIIGLLLFLFNFIIPLQLAFRNKNNIYIVFLCLFAISAISEAVLSSQKGVVFFALFNSILFLGLLNKQTDN